LTREKPGWQPGVEPNLKPVFSAPATQAVNWTAQPFHNGDLISFSNSGGALPAEISNNCFAGCFVMNAGTNALDVSPSFNQPDPPFAVTPSTAGTGTSTGTGSQYSLNNTLEGWKNSSSFGGQFVTDMVSNFFNVPPGGSSGVKHSSAFGWFALQGFSIWSLQPGSTISTPYASYTAMRAANHKSL
jgi:hypothetical protein